jgi:hypothetical protein
MQHIALAGAFDKFLGMVGQLRATRQIGEKAMARWRPPLLMLVCAAWNEYVEEVKDSKHRMAEKEATKLISEEPAKQRIAEEIAKGQCFGEERVLSGGTSGMIGVGQDITERNIAEREKTRLAKELLSFIDTAKELLSFIDTANAPILEERDLLFGMVKANEKLRETEQMVELLQAEVAEEKRSRARAEDKMRGTEERVRQLQAAMEEEKRRSEMKGEAEKSIRATEQKVEVLQATAFY